MTQQCRRRKIMFNGIFYFKTGSVSVQLLVQLFTRSFWILVHFLRVINCQCATKGHVGQGTACARVIQGTEYIYLKHWLISISSRFYVVQPISIYILIILTVRCYLWTSLLFRYSCINFTCVL